MNGNKKQNNWRKDIKGILKDKEFEYSDQTWVPLYWDDANLKNRFKKSNIIAWKNKVTIIIEIEKDTSPKNLIGIIGSVNISNCYKIKEGDLKPLNDISLFIIIPEMSESTKEQIKTIKTYFKSWIGEGSLKDFEIVTIDEFENML